MNDQQVRLPKPREIMTQPRILPQEVLSQLRAHSSSLPAPIRGMVSLLLESWIRMRELCMLPCDCLVRDSSADWFLRYCDLKFKQERIIPLSSQAVMAVQEQQALRQDIVEGTAPDYLFLNTKGQPYSPRTFLDILNRIAHERDIRDETGNIWRFRAFQFRNTFLTHMFRRSGVPLYELLGYLVQTHER